MPTRNPLLLELTKKIEAQYRAGIPTRWDLVIPIIRRIPTPKINSATHLRRFLSEAQVRITLERAAETFGDSVEFDPIEDGAYAGTLLYSYIDGNLRVTTGGGKRFCEIDLHLMVDGLPVIVEVTMDGGRTYKDMAWERIWRKREAVLIYHQGAKDIGYVTIIPPESFSAESRDKVRLIESGGIVLPFYTTKQGFERESIAIGKRYGFDVNIKNRK